MTSETAIREQAAAAAPEAPAEVLNRVVESVRRDSRQDPQNYLEESTVPHGGE